MIIKAHCICETKDKTIIGLLNKYSVKYSTSDNLLIFDINSKQEYYNELIELLDKHNRKPILEVKYSKEELKSSNWFIMEATRAVLDNQNDDFTFIYSCAYQTYCTHWKHRIQKNSFVVKKTPKWKTSYNFCSEDTGNYSFMFCSDYAKHTLTNNNITGVDFLPVLHTNLSSQQININQITSHHKISFLDVEFLGKYKTIVCPTCGKTSYAFEIPMANNIKLKTDNIPQGIDVFISDFIVGEGFGAQNLIVSQKVYQLISEEMKEKYIRFTPIA